MPYTTALRCRECGREYPLDARYSCEFCFGPLEAAYDYAAVGRRLTRARVEAGPFSMWRYADLLPVDAADAVELGVGFTPLLRAQNLGEALGLRHLYLKNDTVNPTWSFKDRVVSVAVTRARELGFQTLACASTGNLANSVAAHAARAGMKAVVFIPADLEQGKVLGSAIYHPTLVAVDGSYDEVNRLCSEVADKYPWAFVNINVRPYYAEGSKTLAYEVAEQLGWRAPDHCVVPLASGSLLTKIWKGFGELATLGLIGGLRARMSGAQARGCSPIVTAWEQGSFNFRPVKPATIAKSLAIGNPADGYYALRTMADSGGAGAAVEDDEIVAGIKLLAESEGIFAEPAGGVTIAALKKLAASGQIQRDEVTVAFVTGSGLKVQEPLEGRLALPVRVRPKLEELEEALGLTPEAVG